MASVNEQLLEITVRHMIFVERFKGSQAKRLIGLFREVELDLVAALARRDPTAVKGRYTTFRLHKLLEDVRELLELFHRELAKDTTAELHQLGRLEAGFAKQHVDRVAYAFETILPDAGTIKATINARPFDGRLLKEWFRDLSDATFARIRREIRMGVAQGQPVADIARRVRGATEISRRAAETVVRTAVSHVTNAARQSLYEANTRVIKGVQLIETLDGRTCVQCMALDGQVHPIDKGPRAPHHLSCRGSSVPVLKGWGELGVKAKALPESTRASMDGQVAASTTYNDFLKRQSAAFQDEVLGRTKGKLFRDGGLTLDRFVDRDGAELTLDELRAKAPEAFAKAGL